MKVEMRAEVVILGNSLISNLLHHSAVGMVSMVGMVGMVYMYVYGEQWAQLWNCHKNLSSAVGEAVLTACNSCQPIISAEKTEVLKRESLQKKMVAHQKYLQKKWSF